jgi:hypothetical protein
METPKALQERVIQAFKERNIPFKREEIEAAFKDESNVRWAQEHLGADTLLSKEETTLYVVLLRCIHISYPSKELSLFILLNPSYPTTSN